MAGTSEIKRGLCMVKGNDIWTVVEFQHVKPGKGAAFVRTKMKNLKNGKVVEENIPAGHKIEIARVERRTFQYLYGDDNGMNFMSQETFEQVSVNPDLIEYPQLLKEGQEVEICTHQETETILSVDLPQSVNLRITYCEGAVAGNTSTNALKQATVETGATIMVPLFVTEGTMIRIKTEDCSYQDRVKE
jgi:elongation factor P